MIQQSNPLVPNVEQISKEATRPRLRYPDPVDGHVDALLRRWLDYDKIPGRVQDSAEHRQTLIDIGRDTLLAMAEHGIPSVEQVYTGTACVATRRVLPGVAHTAHEAPVICEAQIKALREIGEWIRFRLDPMWPSGTRYYNDAIEWVRHAVEWADLLRED